MLKVACFRHTIQLWTVLKSKSTKRVQPHQCHPLSEPVLETSFEETQHNPRTKAGVLKMTYSWWCSLLSEAQLSCPLKSPFRNKNELLRTDPSILHHLWQWTAMAVPPCYWSVLSENAVHIFCCYCTVPLPSPLLRERGASRKVWWQLLSCLSL